MPKSGSKHDAETSRTIGKIGSSIVAPERNGPSGAKTERGAQRRPWFLSSTPDALRVPLLKDHAEVWSKTTLNLEREREKLRRHDLPKKASALWPDDEVDARSPGGRAVMGSHKLMSAKEQSLELQLLAKRQVDEYFASRKTKKDYDAETDQEEQTYRDLGMTKLEMSLDQFGTAQASLRKLRMGAMCRPPDNATTTAVALEASLEKMRRNYHQVRGKDAARVLDSIGLHVMSLPYSHGGPSSNRHLPNPDETRPMSQNLHDPLQLVFSPRSPMGYQMVKGSTLDRIGHTANSAGSFLNDDDDKYSPYAIKLRQRTPGSAAGSVRSSTFHRNETPAAPNSERLSAFPAPSERMTMAFPASSERVPRNVGLDGGPRNVGVDGGPRNVGSERMTELWPPYEPAGMHQPRGKSGGFSDFSSRKRMVMKPQDVSIQEVEVIDRVSIRGSPSKKPPAFPPTPDRRHFRETLEDSRFLCSSPVVEEPKSGEIEMEKNDGEWRRMEKKSTESSVQTMSDFMTKACRYAPGMLKHRIAGRGITVKPLNG